MPVRMWWQIFQTWINYLIQGFSLQLKMDRLKYWSWWLYFSSRREPSVLKTGRIFRRCYILLFWDFFFSKREEQIHSNFDKQMFIHLSRIQHKVVLLALGTVFAVGFWLPSFLQLKLWARIPLKTGDSPSAVFLYLRVNFHKWVSVAF